MNDRPDHRKRAAKDAPLRVAELVAGHDLTVLGDLETALVGACALDPGRAGHLGFAERAGQADVVAASQASVAVLPGVLAEHFTGTVILSETPRLTFARLAARFEKSAATPGIAPSAVIDERATTDPTACIAPRVVIAADVCIGCDTVIEAGAVIGAAVSIGARCRIGANAVVMAGARLGDAVTVGAGAVIGERGFGLVAGPEGLEPVPQLGRVIIGDRVEIGANTTIDRGALDDTTIAEGVKIDNQVHIAHNCVIGAHTVIAGCTGIAGSCHIGAGCMIGGGVGIGDHVTIADGVTITAASQVPKNIDAAGVYSSTFRAMPGVAWRRRLALFRALDKLEKRLSRVEDNHGQAGAIDE